MEGDRLAAEHCARQDPEVKAGAKAHERFMQPLLPPGVTGAVRGQRSVNLSHRLGGQARACG